MGLNSKAKISVITPLYKGKVYLEHLRKMIRENAEIAASSAYVEWVISNDYPDEQVVLDDKPENFSMIVLNAEENRGIQGARVTGLNYATGDYVLFLDQDDSISSQWIRSQLEHIGTSDAVVCDGVFDGKPLHGKMGMMGELDECITREYNISVGFGFFPGQVMIKKSSIPELWKKRWLKNNCCDDYYLWLSMFENGCVFGKNPEKLYSHNNTNMNMSYNSSIWIKSMIEMVHILIEEEIIRKEDMDVFLHARERVIQQEVERLYCQNQKLEMYKYLSQLEKGFRSFGVDISKLGCIAVYGFEEGEYLAANLKNKGFSIECIIDCKAEEIESDFKVVKKEEIPSNIDTVISTLVSDKNKAEIQTFFKMNYPKVKLLDWREII